MPKPDLSQQQDRRMPCELIRTDDSRSPRYKRRMATAVEARSRRQGGARDYGGNGDGGVGNPSKLLARRPKLRDLVEALILR